MRAQHPIPRPSAALEPTPANMPLPSGPVPGPASRSERKSALGLFPADSTCGRKEPRVGATFVARLGGPVSGQGLAGGAGGDRRAKPSRSCLGLVGVLLICTLACLGCREQVSAPLPPVPTNAVALVGTQAISAETFQLEWARRAQSAAGLFPTPAAKQALLEELIGFEALRQKAVAAGYDRDPEIAASLARLIVVKYQADQFAKLGAPKVAAGEIAEFYRNHPERFGAPEQVRAAVIEMAVPRAAAPEKRAEAAARAAAVWSEARTNASPDGTFGLLAQRHSAHQPSRYRGGDIGWWTRGTTNSEWPPAVMAALFSLAQPGELAPVIATPAGFYLVKLVEREPARVRPLAEVQDGVAYLVARRKEQERQEELRASAKQGLAIRINQALLESIAAPSAEAKPPGGPGQPISSPGRDARP